MNYVGIFAANLLPVFLAAGAGYALAARTRLDPRSISRLAFTVFAPCLIFRVILDGGVPAVEMLRMMGFAASTLAVLAALAWAASRAMGLGRTTVSAVVLCTLLPNAGNLGLSVNLFAFGEDGLAQASLFFLTGFILTYTVGILVASLGRAGLKEASIGLLRVPAIWSLVLAFVMLNRGWSLPLPLDRAVRLLADACIPTFLVILGIQLRTAGWRAPARPLALAVGLRLGASIAVAILLGRIWNLEGPALQAGVLQSAMPTAVITIVLAAEYDLEPGLVTSVVFVSTLLSPLTLTPLLAWLH